MKRITIHLIILLIMSSGCCANAQALTSLLSLQPVSGGTDEWDQKLSIGDQIYKNCLVSKDGPKFAVYDLGGKFSRLQGWIGVPDGWGDEDKHKYAITVDGKIALAGEVLPGDKPIHVDLDVTGAQSLRWEASFHIAFADPILAKASLPTATGGNLSGVANLVAPKDGIKLTASSVNLLWAPVDGATGYGVEIVCTKGTSPHIYSMNATDSTARFSLAGIPNGEYHWSVIAFNGSGVMGKFSKDRTFVVAR